MKAKELLILSNSYSANTVGKLKKDNARHIGKWMIDRRKAPRYIIASPTNPVKNTLKHIFSVTGNSINKVHWEKKICCAKVNELVDLLESVRHKSDRILLVGHHTETVPLLCHLTGKVPVNHKFHQADIPSLARLTISNKRSLNHQQSTRLIEMIHPKSSLNSMPFPCANQQRRPEYAVFPEQYTHSGVIPYRIIKNKLKILLVSSQSHKRWTIPKGNIEPCITLQQAAQAEAYEEAGVLGDVKSTVLGSYRYHKDGRKCRVAVYAMKVKTIFPQKTWKENYRSRIWLSPEAAINHVEFPDLKKMIKQFADNK